MTESGQLAHPADADLLRRAEDELPPREERSISEHLASCAACRERLREIEVAIGEYVRYHEDILKPSLPPPPHEWEDLRPRFRRAARPRLSWRWAAAAAAIVLAAAAVWRLDHAPEVSAAELLEKASARETLPQPKRSIRIRSRNRTLVRPARLSAGQPDTDTSGLHALFQKADWSWEDPLSATAYAGWRARLAHKQDVVKHLADRGLYVLETSGDPGPLTEATLTLNADLRAIRGTLRFEHDELVEITETADPEPSLPARAAAPQPRAEIPFAPRELRALEGLHAIGADLGEPLELSREGGKVVVTGTGLGRQRQEQVRQALGNLDGVELRFDDAGSPSGSRAGSATAASASARGAARLPAEIERRLAGRISAEEFTNGVLDASDAVLARGYALRALARRFPPEVERTLESNDRSTLAALREEHAQALARQVRTLWLLLAPVLPDSQPDNETAEAGASWQAGAERVLDAAQQVDRSLNVALAGGEGGADAIARLESELRNLQRISAAYAAREGR